MQHPHSFIFYVHSLHLIDILQGVARDVTYTYLKSGVSAHSVKFASIADTVVLHRRFAKLVVARL